MTDCNAHTLLYAVYVLRILYITNSLVFHDFEVSSYVVGTNRCL